MIKNTVKLMMATTLATALVVVVTESADAQIRGRKYSRSNDVPSLSFDLIFKTSEGQIIPDHDQNASNEAGDFRGAIRNFFYLGSGDVVRFNFDLGNLSTKLEKDTVKYTISSPDIFQLSVDDKVNEKLTFDINPGPVYTFELNVKDFSEEVKNNYVNSLHFIVENNWYNPENFKSESFVEETLGFDFALPERGNPLKPLIVTDIPDTTPSNPHTVPEPSTSIPSLFFGAFSIGLVLKRNMKMKQS